MILRRPKYFTAYQSRWKDDRSRLRICVKSRQVGLSFVDSYDSVILAASKKGRDVWIISRDEIQSGQSHNLCKRWARILGYAASDFGEQVFTAANGKPVKVRVLTFASGASIYALSSNPDAIVGKTGHVKLDEFALHKDQRTLYAVAKPVIQWGGTLSIISTHRGIGTMFHQLILDIKHAGNPMGWSLHEVPIQKAVDEGLVEKINAATGRSDSREHWLAQQRAECIDEEQWLQEYCCVPADESTAFFSHDLITGCEDLSLQLFSLDELLVYMASHPDSVFYAGMDFARKNDLCVIDVGEKIGDVMWDRSRIELRNTPYAETRSLFWSILNQPNLQRACIDATGNGNQLGEESQNEFGWKAEPLAFTAPLKEQLAFGMRHDLEDKRLRMPRDDKLRADLRAIKKEVTLAGNLRLAGQTQDSHCDRTWAKALRQYAARTLPDVGALVG